MANTALYCPDHLGIVGFADRFNIEESFAPYGNNEISIENKRAVCGRCGVYCVYNVNELKETLFNLNPDKAQSIIDELLKIEQLFVKKDEIAIQEREREVLPENSFKIKVDFKYDQSMIFNSNEVVFLDENNHCYLQLYPDSVKHIVNPSHVLMVSRHD